MSSRTSLCRRRRLKDGLLAHLDELHVRATLDAPLLRLGQRKGAAAARVDAMMARDKIGVLRDIIVARQPSGRFVDADNVAELITVLCRRTAPTSTARRCQSTVRGLPDDKLRG